MHRGWEAGKLGSKPGARGRNRHQAEGLPPVRAPPRIVNFVNSEIKKTPCTIGVVRSLSQPPGVLPSHRAIIFL